MNPRLMRRTISKVLVGLFGASFLLACGPLDEDAPEFQDEIPSESPCTDCGEWSVDEEESDPASPPEEQDAQPEPAEPAPEPKSACQPQAIAVSAERLPEIPDEVRSDSCPLESEKTHQVITYGDDQLIDVEWEWDGTELLRVEEHAGVEAGRTNYVFDDNLERLERVEHRQNILYAHPVPGESDFVLRSWEFDDKERLLSFEEERWSEWWDSVELIASESVEQSWDGERLIGRTEINSHDDERVTELSWNYDDAGRLIEVTEQVDGEVLSRSVWTYEGDKPSSVERFVNEISVERQNWNYEDKALASRQIEVASTGLDGELDAPYMSSHVDAHDSYTARALRRNEWGFSEVKNAWYDANTHLHVEEGADCYVLPTSVGHGYPDDEASYHLGWSDTGEDPENIGFAYGYAGYAYGYGNHSWYGHLGIASEWPNSGHHSSFARSEMTYDEQGQMVNEKLVFSTWQHDSTVTVERDRMMGSAGVERDRIAVHDEEGASGDAELRFERNDQGLLTARERFRNGEPVSHQHWSYDEDGNVIELDVFTEFLNQDDELYAYYGSSAHPSPAALFEEQDTTDAYVITYIQEFDEQGQKTYLGQLSRDDEESPSTVVSGETETFIQWGEFGKTEKITKWHGGITSISAWEYDDRGELKRETLDNGGDGEINRESRYFHDDQGRLIEEITTGYSESHIQRSYACGG